MDKTVLVVSENSEPTWPHALEDALAPLAGVQVLTTEQALVLSAGQPGDLLLLDAASLAGDVVDLIEHLLGAHPGLPIVVATTSTTWQRARQALRAGASDYIRKSLDKDVILASLHELLTA